MNIPRKKSRPLFTRILMWGLPSLVVLLVAGFIAAKVWVNSYLRSEAFRQLIGGITAQQLKATGEYKPFQFAGTTIYSDEFKAHGMERAAFTEMGVDQIKAEINLRGLWKRAWQIDEINIQRVQVSLGDLGQTPVQQEEETVTATTPEQAQAQATKSRWLPDHVDLRKVVVHETNLTWAENTTQAGAATGVMITVTPDGEAWNLLCEGGSIKQKGAPDLTLDQARLRYQRPTMFITDAQLKYGTSGGIAVSGEANEKSYDVHGKLNGIPVTPFLPEDWRQKLKGNAFGEVRVRGAAPLLAQPEIEGTINLAEGQLEALPVLNQIALFTQTQRFRILNLSKATAHFVQSTGKTTVTNFIMESEGLIRVEGNFIVENSLIDGTFQVGVTPSSLQWLPGSQSKVFTLAHDGYVWTTVRLTGPVNSPSEDLTARLKAAAGEEVIDTVNSLIQQVPGGSTLPGAAIDKAKGLLDGVLGPLK